MPPGFVNRLRSNSIPLNTIAPKATSQEYSHELAELAIRVLYRSPLPSPSDLPIYVLDSAALPDARPEVYDRLFPYILARLPDEEELIGGLEYEIVFFAGGNAGSTSSRPVKGPDEDDEQHEDDKQRKGPLLTGRKTSKPGFGWFMKAYNVLSRATRKRLKKIYIVHERRWVRVLMEMFATVVSPKFRKKVVHVSSLTALALHLPIEDLLIPPSAYITDRKKVSSIYVPYASGKRAFNVQRPLPHSLSTELPRLPRVLRETTRFLFTDPLIATEGLFRVSARQQSVEILREAFDRGQKFIIWQDGSVLMTAPHYREGVGEVSVKSPELDHQDGYDVHTAGALIKLWYKELKEPIFPSSTYQALSKYYGSPGTSLDANTLTKMLDPGVEYSVVTPVARQLLTMHLLPLLSDVAANSETNRMTPSNLAVCFAPNLLCGPDPVEDMKMSVIVRNILTALIENWSERIAPALNLTSEKLQASLDLPANPEDWEDPLDEDSIRSPSSGQRYGSVEAQISGITLVDNHVAPQHTDGSSSSSDVPIEADDSSDSDDDQPPAMRNEGQVANPEANDSARPPLPPRPSASLTDVTTSPSSANPSKSDNIQRKPAPPLATLPRYSTIITDPNSALPRAESSAQTHQTPDKADPPSSIAEAVEESSATTHAHRNSVATLPPYEEWAPSGTRLQREVIDEAPEPTPGGEDAEERGRAASVPSIPRKPVGEGKLGGLDR